MSEINLNLKKLYNIFNSTNLTFDKRKRIDKSYGSKNIFLKHQKQTTKKETLLLGNIPNNHLCFTSRIYNMDKYNPKRKIKNGIFKIKALDKTHPDFKLIENNKKRNKTYIDLNHSNSIYKVSNRILGSEFEEYKKINNNLLNVLNEKVDYEYKILLEKYYNKNKTNHFFPKYKNAQTNTIHSITDRKYIDKFPPINNQLLKKYFNL